MTLWTFSADGVTPGELREVMSPRFTRRIDTGAWSIPTSETAEQFGWFPVTVTERPDVDHVADVIHDGAGFVQRWNLDENLAAARVAAEVRETKRRNVDNAVATLREWAADADATTVTSGNAVAVLDVVVDRLGVFFDRFADLIESDRP